jgi:CO/xanthine dehydrogenase Mo-binding subunit
VGDIRLSGMLHVAFVRCPWGAARIRRVSAGTALALPGVSGVFTAAELPELGTPMPLLFPSTVIDARVAPLLAGEIVRHAGEPVAAVVATHARSAAAAADAVDVDYEELPCVVDLDVARRSKAILVHRDMADNLAGSLVNGFGDIDAAFAGAPVVISERFHAERTACASMEPRGIVAEPGTEDGPVLTLYASTQAPHAIRRGVAMLLDVEPAQVRVVAPDVGGGFGPKGRLYREEAVLSVLARHLGRPLSWTATRREDFLTTYQGRGAAVEAEVAAGEDGRLQGLRVRFLQDLGAYASTALIVPQNSAQHLLGPYRWPAAHIEIEAVYTNKAPLTPLRGGGREIGVWVTERMLDHLAARLDIDPLAVRERNLIRADEFPHDTGYPSRMGGTLTYDSGDYHGCLEKCRQLIHYAQIHEAQPDEREQGRYRGVAVTLFLESTGMAAETARARLHPDGTIDLRVGSPSTGQGHATTISQMFAERFGIDVARVVYSSGDTGAVEDGIGTFGSRMAVVAGNAAAKAGMQLRALVLERAADEMEAAIEDLEIVGDAVRVRGVPESALSLAKMAATATSEGDELAVDATFTAERGSSFAGGAHGALVEVDVETGFVTVERYVVVHDCGTVINPTIVEGQIHGGVAHGLGNALGERMVYDEHGRLVTDSFLSYAMPLATDCPRVVVEHHESPSPYNPAGIKGAGEGGTIGALATVARAVEDALSPLNVKINRLPIAPQALFEACAPLREGVQSSGFKVQA